MDSSNNLFANDGSFLERFKQLQQQQTAPPPESSSSVPDSVEPSKNGFTVKKATFSSSAAVKPSSQHQKAPLPSSGKLAFSLKQKTKVINPLKLSDEEEEGDNEDAEQPAQGSRFQAKKPTGSSNLSIASSTLRNSIPLPPKDPEVKKVADKLAQFVAKNGRQFEDLTRKKNADNPLFRFLFDLESPDYKYYNYCVTAGEKANESDVNGNVNNIMASRTTQYSQGRSSMQTSSYQTPASALYSGSDAERSQQTADSVSMMEFYMKRAAEEDMRKPHKRSRDEMPPPESLQTQSPPVKKGHHMGDYIPPEELEKFLAKCNTHGFNKEAEERSKIQPDNVGHKLLSKMGWKEGEGLGSGKGGRADPVEAGAIKMNNLGVGAVQPGEVTPDDDIYEQYKKRMMLGYRYRPNPLNNPRKAYY